MKRKDARMVNRTKGYLNQLVGKPLEDVRLACEMIMLDFGNIGIHAQGFTRIMEGSDILLTTLDYLNWDEVTDTNNDEWYNLAQYKSRIVGNKVTAVELTSSCDLTIRLENQICIQAFNSNGPSHYGDIEEQEQWRVLLDDEDMHIVVYQKNIEFHS